MIGRIFLFVGLFLIPIICKSQQIGYAKYRADWIVVSNYECTGYLYFSQDKSYFSNQNDSGTFNNPIVTHEKSLGIIDNINSIENNDGISKVTTVSKINILDTRRDPFNIYVDLKKNELIQEVEFKKGDNKKEFYQVKEEIGLINWKIENEFKEYGLYHCQKATCLFRGRFYTAWFTTEIPVSFGPWKFNGLPGLILEIFDSEHEVMFQLMSIELQNLNKEVKVPSIGNEVSLKEYIKKALPITREEAEDMARIVSSKSPQGSTIEMGYFKVSFSGIEKDFEFTF